MELNNALDPYGRKYKYRSPSLHPAGPAGTGKLWVAGEGSLGGPATSLRDGLGWVWTCSRIVKVQCDVSRWGRERRGHSMHTGKLQGDPSNNECWVVRLVKPSFLAGRVGA